MKKILTIAVLAFGALAIATSISLGHRLSVPANGRVIEDDPGRETQMQPGQREQQRPTKITEAQAKHIVAYYFKAQNKLVVYNQKSLAAGIKKGLYRLTWKPGASRATLSVPVSRLAASGKHIIVPVRYTAAVEYGESPGRLVGWTTNVGETKLVENQELKNVTGKKGPCNPGEGKKNSKAWRFVTRTYTYLDGDGDQSGQETYMEYGEYYLYAVKDCSKGYLGSEDPSSTWMLSWQPWPLP